MKNSEFIALLAANTNKTTHIRTYAGAWYSGVSRVPDELTTKIGKVIALIQEKINEGLLCDKNKECLLVYNFQLGAVHNDPLYCHMDMLIKPLSEIHKTKENTGRPLQLVVDGKNGQVANITKSLLDLELITEAEAKEEELAPPKVYGSYNDFKAICCFAALASYRPFSDMNILFTGEYDDTESVHNSVSFNSLVEARKYLATRNELGRYILEVTAAKEDYPNVLKEGLSKQLLKVMNHFNMDVKVTPKGEIHCREDKMCDQLERLEHVKNESTSPMVGKKETTEDSEVDETKKKFLTSPTVKNIPQKSNKEEEKIPSLPVRKLSGGFSSPIQ